MILQTDPKLMIFKKTTPQAGVYSTAACKAPELIGANSNEHVFFEIDSDDLAPEFRKGDVIVCREIPRGLWQNKLPFDKSDFVISHPSKGNMVKQIMSHDVEAGIIVCRSLGRDCSDVELNLDEVTNLYFVIEHRISASNKRKLSNSKFEYLETRPIYMGTQKYNGDECIAFEIRGDGMDSGTNDGVRDRDIVLGREVKRELWRSKLQINTWDFIIVHKDGITIKRISEHDVERGIIKCHPLNPIYEDFDLHLDEVIELYELIKVVDRSKRR